MKRASATGMLQRAHAAFIGLKTPEVVYLMAAGGGATIVDKFNEATEASVPV
ncbi:MAG: hypothetical protein Q7U30_03415 [Methylicorpusculum sp.]|nr:hypothetical protein [Methylicorpusculum sp.]